MKKPELQECGFLYKIPADAKWDVISHFGNNCK